jgi:hypothetical protein
MVTRFIERRLQRRDSEDSERVVRFRLWRMRWFPYRVHEIESVDMEHERIVWGPSKWRKPDVLSHPWWRAE